MGRGAGGKAPGPRGWRCTEATRAPAAISETPPQCWSDLRLGAQHRRVVFSSKGDEGDDARRMMMFGFFSAWMPTREELRKALWRCVR